MKTSELTVEKRFQKGKNAARRLRRQKKIPAVLYGKGAEPVALEVDYQRFTAIMHGQESRNTLFNLRITDGEEAEVLSLPREIQFHPVDGTVMHVDFQQIHLDEPIHTQVPIHVTGSSPGVKEGGVLEHLMRELDVACLPMEIPEQIEADISEMNIGDSLHLSDLKIPDNVRVLSDAHRTVVLVAAPTVEKVPEAVEEEVVEGEEKAAAEEPEKTEATTEKQD